MVFGHKRLRGEPEVERLQRFSKVEPFQEHQGDMQLYSP